MKRRDFVKTVGAAAAALAVPGCREKSDRRREINPPNLLVIVTDDQRYDALGCVGNPIIQTSFMDRLAMEGVRFEQAFVTTPICAASRASLFTGLYEGTHRYTFTKPPLSHEMMGRSYPALLRNAGYHTGFVGKFGIQVEEGATDVLFDRFHPTAYPYLRETGDGIRHLTDIHGEMAVDFLRRRPKDRPFCLSLSFWAPHAEDNTTQQYFWPPSCSHLYRDVTIPPPPLSDPEFFDALPLFLRESLNRIRWHWRFDTPEKYQAMVKGYYRMISGVDRVLGRLMEELARQGLDRNTVIVFTSDNGYFLGERGFAGKWLMHEPSIRVPLIVRDPRLPRGLGGNVRRDPVLNIDVAPTLLDLAGIPIPVQMQGRSFMGSLRKDIVLDGRDIFCEHLWNNPQIPQSECLRSAGWKYIRYLKHPEYEELYNLNDDPHESRNLAFDAEHAPRLQMFRRRCREKAESLRKKRDDDEGM